MLISLNAKGDDFAEVAGYGRHSKQIHQHQIEDAAFPVHDDGKGDDGHAGQGEVADYAKYKD